MTQEDFVEEELLPTKQDEWGISPTSSHDNGAITRQLSLTRSLSEISNDEIRRKEVINISTSNPSHLFWVPASQHPEIAPAEFEKYVKAHGLVIRRRSEKRRQSILSVYFTANEEEDKSIKKSLQRSASLQTATAGEYARNIPDLLIFDRNSSPLDKSRALVPKADRPLLRRGARTNFKRNSSLNKSPTDHDKDFNYSQNRTSKHDDEGVIVTDAVERQKEVHIPATENDHVRDLCVATRRQEEYDIITSEPDPIAISRSVSTSLSTANNRKSSWSWAFWLDEKSAKKNNKVDSEEQQQKDSHNTTLNHKKVFTLSSLFSRKSKNNQQQNYTSNIETMTSGLLTKPSNDIQLHNPMNMTRLPLHVERAIYRLSHIKLANPRRPLHEQVLISNQMFWYLSVIACNQNTAETKLIEEKKRRKRLVKKQRAPPKNSTTKFISSNRSTESTGFIVPENYLNPSSLKRPMKAGYNTSLYHKQQPQSSDSSSSEDDDSLSSDEDED
ncbi:uncharacterized protein BX663DRAFT_469414 [Cokeromyces recurvatus]|uniref:uncharacterized protein n=1 Tax=Cokeromyces recurvatus TaxID=90255 RepID=UPI00222100C8|nr:uncharacterized protein BX663DRAFT_469414 [Cokeromyces recurvatus]KAI7904556.1 hypothetical protein BX663DRAFT_469414 [Cokeromyces recurvatus]